MVVFRRRENAAKVPGIEGYAAALGGAQSIGHFIGLSAIFATEIDHSTGFDIEHIVTFILGEWQAEVLAGILGGGMHLVGKIAAAHGIGNAGPKRP